MAQNWRKAGLCRGSDPLVFYPPSEDDALADQAKTICGLCAVRQTCLEFALTTREKALIALAVAHSVQCPYCIDAFTTSALEQGSNEEQMTEAIHVAAAIRGGASLVHGVQMRNHLQRLGM